MELWGCDELALERRAAPLRRDEGSRSVLRADLKPPLSRPSPALSVLGVKHSRRRSCRL